MGDDDELVPKVEAKPPSKEWMITLADLLSLLMVFFVMIHVILLTKNDEDIDGVVKSLNRELHTPTMQLVTPYIKAYQIRNYREDEPPATIFYWYNFFTFFLKDYGFQYGAEIRGQDLMITLPAEDLEYELQSENLTQLVDKLSKLIGEDDFKVELIRYIYQQPSGYDYAAAVREQMLLNQRTAKLYNHKMSANELIDNMVKITTNAELVNRISIRIFQNN